MVEIQIEGEKRKNWKKIKRKTFEAETNGASESRSVSPNGITGSL